MVELAAATANRGGGRRGKRDAAHIDDGELLGEALGAAEMWHSSARSGSGPEKKGGRGVDVMLPDLICSLYSTKTTRGKLQDAVAQRGD